MSSFIKRASYAQDYLAYSVGKFTREKVKGYQARFSTFSREVVQQVFHPDQVIGASKVAGDREAKELASRVITLVSGKQSERDKIREAEELWLKANDLDPDLAKTEGFVEFLKNTKLHEHAKLHGHEIRNNKRLKQPEFMLNGKYITYKKFLKNYEFDETFGVIFKKRSSIIFEYTSRGLCQINPETWGQVPEAILPGSKESLTSNEAWLKERHLAPEFREIEGFVDFLRNTKIYSNARFYEHPLPFDENTLQPLIMVAGEYITYEQFLKEYEVREVHGEHQIFNRSTQKRCAYLDRGIVEHDPTKEIVPFKHGASSKTYTVTFMFYAKGHTDSASGIRKYRRHAWINLKNAKGDVFSMGALSNGYLNSPDPYEFLPDKKKAISFVITQEQYEELLKMAGGEQSSREGEFNWLINNCSTFAGRVAGHLFPTVNPRSRLEEHNTLEHRIKAFVYAREMTTELMKPGTVEKLEGVRKEMEKSQSIKNSAAKAALAAAAVEHFRGILTRSLGSSQLDDMSGESLLQLMLSDVIRNKADGLIKEIIQDIEKGNKNALQDKIHNLMWDIFEINHNLEVDHPSQLFSRVRKQEGAHLATV